MLHTIWKGTLSFGTIVVPIRLHGAVEEKGIKLRQLHKECYTPIKHEKTCPKCEKEVGSDEIIKGYETVTGQFVPITEEELDGLKKPFREDKDIQFSHVVDVKEIDPIYFDKTYFISPTETSQNVYALLQLALQQTNKGGMTQVFLYSKQQLAIVRSYEHVLVLQTLHYGDEIRPLHEIPDVSQESFVNEKDLQIAMHLMDQLSISFEADTYKDQFTSTLQTYIEQKMVKGDVVSSDTTEPHGDIRHLMDVLKTSLESNKTTKMTTTHKQTQAESS
ncbi:Ku protein [Metabacillus iocasae]|uniref:Non-homologous end joining protein Ku n=1 Tax=Priestia iocasae TaxID=2291674 RepID=A0ABS2QWJ9_9BACI|nr:Ku protein [Metabacillus iocasae]MBM7703790.1 DNA end-binding protein Ku [Metabacillus iocasae]